TYRRSAFTRAGQDVEICRVGELARAEAIDQTALLARIIEILLGRAEKEMRRIAARRVIAFVARVQAVRDRTVRQFPRHTMCRHRSTLAIDHARDLAVPANEGTGPDPAARWMCFVDLGPEAIGYTDFERRAVA